MYKRYEELRNNVGLKDSDVSKETGIPSSTFSDWKSGRSKPKLEKLIKIAEVLNVRVIELIDDNETDEEKITQNDIKIINQLKSNMNAIHRLANNAYDILTYDFNEVTAEHVIAMACAIDEIAERWIDDAEFEKMLQKIERISTEEGD